ncbi:hypothetical protein FRX31_025143 [Thalictrum thalictroides]|uniref:Uncharacterized protein n=1 Tax=Thalictrum thalictroides TaxID=46969 RepID=A0A7J6VMA2_THATH|nr:hypothetical protein FRX31_025143 [Thalictrum thalictroides]
MNTIICDTTEGWNVRVRVSDDYLFSTNTLFLQKDQIQRTIPKRQIMKFPAESAALSKEGCSTDDHQLIQALWCH